MSSDIPVAGWHLHKLDFEHDEQAQGSNINQSDANVQALVRLPEACRVLQRSLCLLAYACLTPCAHSVVVSDELGDHLTSVSAHMMYVHCWLTLHLQCQAAAERESAKCPADVRLVCRQARSTSSTSTTRRSRPCSRSWAYWSGSLACISLRPLCLLRTVTTRAPCSRSRRRSTTTPPWLALSQANHAAAEVVCYASHCALSRPVRASALPACRCTAPRKSTCMLRLSSPSCAHTGTVVGGPAGGALGAGLGELAGDAVDTGISSAEHGSCTPEGLLKEGADAVAGEPGAAAGLAEDLGTTMAGGAVAGCVPEASAGAARHAHAQVACAHDRLDLAALMPCRMHCCSRCHP